MLPKIMSGLLILVGVIHLLPVTGFLGVGRLQALYGVALEDPNLIVLMRHRALLFAIVGLLLIAGAFVRDWQTPAIVAGLISIVGFQVLAVPAEGLNDAVRRVVLVDWVALGLLVCAAAIRLTNRATAAS